MLGIILLMIILKIYDDNVVLYKSKFKFKLEIKKCLKFELEVINKIVE